MKLWCFTTWEMCSTLPSRLCHIGRIKDVEFKYNLTDYTPVARPPYRLSYSELTLLKQIINELLHYKLIRKSQSPYAAPVLFVSKKDEGAKTRLCVDFRAINKITVPDSFPLPRIEDIINQLKNSLYYTTLDITSGFHHIAIAEEHKKYTAFSTPFGHYECSAFWWEKFCIILPTNLTLPTRKTRIDKFLEELHWWHHYS